jgi:cytochrome c553
MAASSGSAPYTWTTAAGSPLPAGLSLSAAGVVTGTPTIAGTISASINVTDAAAGTATKTFSITINAAGSSLSITTATLASATYGTAYSQPLAATGGTTPYTWAVASGTLPAGFTLSAAGVITGTPAAPAVPNAATSNFTVKVTDAVSASATMPLATTASVSASASSGRTTYDASCAGCHRLGIYDVTGGSPNLGGLGAATLTTALDARFAGGASHNSRTLSAALITDMFNFLNLY